MNSADRYLLRGEQMRNKLQLPRGWFFTAGNSLEAVKTREFKFIRVI